MEVSIWLAHSWAFLLATAVFIYVVLDGFDLGVGILYPFFPEKKDRDLMMNTVAPVWDGNETWLVLGGGGLFAAFPMAYGIIMPALYAPIIAMLLALVFRGVAFEYRWRTLRWNRYWDRAFIGGSITAAFAQGVTLGAWLQGIEVDGRAYGGGWFDWLSPFSLLTGAAVVMGYGLLGATWLLMKTEGPVHDRARYLAWRFAVATIAFIAVVSFFTPFVESSYSDRWFEMPGLILAAPVPLAVAVLTFLLFQSINRRPYHYSPFVLSLALFALCFVGLGVSVYPYIVPTEVTILDAATPFKSQIFMFVGAVILIPIILAYTGYAYWVFRGKIDPDAGYH
ncbi:putative cytochrome bd-quinol oxidase subunit II [Parvularcula bermudensis HTCC2503]|uniref:Putative cytochrome bd-quinol oxidase subunit II n=1 Tax=Parvularcula bermudensis (strain ATCC BAA-594 / HTCC2503 / KCTC 12087) TaxID=314260 RepID=E0THD1_PARBH|nr:cytochrome d ubiquinol oxidase subunit II [Parvularcula bermudensis]ADM10723.1 putative cytochrome bd-quinol oxidase subunit II [Parvularcula bermudensis HTCC2503]